MEHIGRPVRLGEHQSSVCQRACESAAANGDDRVRTGNLRLAKPALSQL